MTNEERKKLYRDAIEKWGEQSQIDQAIEELAELIVALRHLSRGRGCGSAVQEVADVSIMLEQVRLILGRDVEIDAVTRNKLERLHDRVRDIPMF